MASEILRRDRQHKTAKRAERSGRRILRPREAQRRLGIGHTTFYEDYVATGRIRLVALGERARGVIEDELDDLIGAMGDARGQS
jgi:predicted DNA-binding transcriptional regulator AlpA